jgi:dTDP-4-amino-4,6-dideoxygalactose transaminase
MYAYAAGTCPAAHEICGRVLSLPMHLRLTKDDVDYIADKVIAYAKQ